MYRLDQVFFRVCVEAFCQDFAEAVEFGVFDMEAVSDSASVFDGFASVEVFMVWRVFLYGFCHGETRPRSLHVDFRIFINEFGGAVSSQSAGFYDLFSLVDHVFDITVSLVGFDGGEFRIVAGIHAFVSEVSGDFENSFIAAYQKSLQVEFRRDTHVHGHVQRIEMGGEWLRIGAAIEWLQHRGFYFQEAVVGVPLTDGTHHSGTLYEGVSDFRIDHEV